MGRTLRKALFSGGNYIASAWDPAAKNANVTLSGTGNVTMTVGGSAAVDRPAHGTTQRGAGAWYFEALIAGSTAGQGIGLCDAAASTADGRFPGFTSDGGGYSLPGNILQNGVVLTTVAGFTVGDVVGVGFVSDGTTGEARFYKNGTLVYTLTGLAGTCVPCGSATLGGALTFNRPATAPIGYAYWG